MNTQADRLRELVERIEARFRYSDCVGKKSRRSYITVDEWPALLRAIRATARQIESYAVPEDAKVVPRDPSVDMLNVLGRILWRDDGVCPNGGSPDPWRRGAMANVYRDLLTAAESERMKTSVDLKLPQQ